MLDSIRRSAIGSISILLFGVLSVFSLSAHSQDETDPDNSSAPENEQTTDATEVSSSDSFGEIVQSIPIEEIVVTAERRTSTIRAELEQARERFFDDYNELNPNDKYDVDCRTTRWTSSQIPQEFCWPVFLERAVSENLVGAFRGVNLFSPLPVIAKQHGSDYAELRSNVARIANENPEIKESLLEFLRLDAALTRKEQECEERPAFLFIFKLCR